MSTKRITVNIIATYAQTVVSLCVGLFCARWVYNALGEIQFGLFSVVGSLIAFVAVLNSALIEGSGRFFAFAIGKQSCETKDRELLCKWFNTALSVQTVIPVVLIIVGGPIGVYAIRNLLTIPDELRQSCIYLYFFSLFSMFSSMVFSPVQALYYAKQFIFVRNLFGVVNTFLLALEGWWLLHYNGNRLVAHAAATTTLMLISNIGFVIIAYKQFPEARIRPEYWFDKKRLKEMFSFSSFFMFGTLGTLFGNSGVAIVLNKFFGPAVNAAMGIGGQVSSKAEILSQPVNTAISPEITSRVGADRFDDAKRLAVRVCIYSTCMSLFIAVPLVVYAQQILVLWLKTPAQYAVQIAVIMIMNMLAERMTVGYMMLVHASGKIRVYTTCLGIGNGGRCLVVLLLLMCGIPLIPTLWIGWFLPFFILNQMRIGFAKQALDVSVRQYLRCVFIPLVAIASSSFGFSFLFKMYAGSSILAILFCSVVNVILVAGLMWGAIGPDERGVLILKFRSAYFRAIKT